MKRMYLLVTLLTICGSTLAETGVSKHGISALVTRENESSFPFCFSIAVQPKFNELAATKTGPTKSWSEEHEPYLQAIYELEDRNSCVADLIGRLRREVLNDRRHYESFKDESGTSMTQICHRITFVTPSQNTKDSACPGIEVQVKTDIQFLTKDIQSELTGVIRLTSQEIGRPSVTRFIVDKMRETHRRQNAYWIDKKH